MTENNANQNQDNELSSQEKIKNFLQLVKEYIKEKGDS